jgi:hypothetical protein
MKLLSPCSWCRALSLAAYFGTRLLALGDDSSVDAGVETVAIDDFCNARVKPAVAKYCGSEVYCLLGSSRLLE